MGGGIIDMAALTEREREVVTLLGEGKRLTEIAAQLCVSYSTVQKHVAAAQAKTGTRTMLQLAIKASHQ